MGTKDNNQKPFGLGNVPADTLHLGQPTSTLPQVLEELNALVKRGIIKDYAIGGGYAKIYYGIPYFTYDLDILVVLDSMDDFHKLYNYYREQGNKIEREYIYIADTAVQFFPDFIDPLFHESIKEAEHIELDGVQSKVISIEYLIALLLKAFRPKDKIHILELSEHTNISKLEEIFRRFDNEQGLLSKRFKEVLGKSSGISKNKR